MNEETVFVCADLPAGERDWVWHADLNLVELRRGLSIEQRVAAVDDLTHWWRRSHLRAVETA